MLARPRLRWEGEAGLLMELAGGEDREVGEELNARIATFPTTADVQVRDPGFAARGQVPQAWCARVRALAVDNWMWRSRVGTTKSDWAVGDEETAMCSLASM